MRWKIRVPENVEFEEVVASVEQAVVHVELAHDRRRIISVSGLDRAPALSASLQARGCTIHDDPQMSVEQRQAEEELAPLLKLSYAAPAVRDLTGSWQPGMARPVLDGRCGLQLVVKDGTTREITYAATSSHEQALRWLTHNAWLEEDELADVHYWTVLELERERWRERAQERAAALQRATFERLLGR